MKNITLLHVGLHKTASTSFQISCKKNQKILEKNGFNYPDLFSLEGGKKTSNHSCALFNIFSRSRADYHLNLGKSLLSISHEVSIYRRVLLSELLKNSCLILSGEDVSSLRLKEQNELAIYLSAFSDSLKTFAVIRSPYSRHCSEFAGMISNGRSLRPTCFKSQVYKIKRLRTNFCGRGNIDEIKFIPFLRSVKSSQGPTGYLLEAMGVRNLGNFEVAFANEGLGNEQVRRQMKLNAKGSMIIGGRADRLWRRDSKTSGKKFLLTKKELELIMPKLLAENKWFEENLGKEYCDTSFPTCD